MGIAKDILVPISDIDIATIEALHDLLLDEKDFKLDHPALVRGRELTAKLYYYLYPAYKKKKL